MKKEKWIERRLSRCAVCGFKVRTTDYIIISDPVAKVCGYCIEIIGNFYEWRCKK